MALPPCTTQIRPLLLSILDWEWSEARDLRNDALRREGLSGLCILLSSFEKVGHRIAWLLIGDMGIWDALISIV